MNEVNATQNPAVSSGVSGLAHVEVQQVKAGFDADGAMNSALNFMADTLLTLTDVVISMGDMSTTIQRTAVKNAQSKVEMYRFLLSAQGLCSDKNWYNGLAKEWSKHSLEYVAVYGSQKEGFKHFTQERGMYDLVYKNVYENPNMTDGHKEEFVFSIAKWYGESNGRLSTFHNKTSVISQQLNQASTYVQDWMSTSESMKPTQVQQSITTLIAQISQVTSMWSNVVSA